jgi:probable F420-dependent oxidoreductase
VGIAVIYGRDPVAMRAGSATVHELSGGRMLLGLGSSHRDTVSEIRGHDYRGPLTAMRDYLALYEASAYRGPEQYGRPPLVLAALRARMLALAATDADGAFPYLVPEVYVRHARARLDAAATHAGRPRPMLIVSLPCLRETEAPAARAAARAYLDRYLGLPNYLNNLREAGFGDDDLAKPGSDRLIDALVAWGDDATLRSRLRAMLATGADQVALIPLTADGRHADRETVEALAPPW